MAGPVAAGASEFEAKLASFVKDNRLYGAAAGVVHGDELAWSSAAGFADVAGRQPSTPDRLYRIASITKTFTGTAIMQLRDAGALDIDDAVVKWIPQLATCASPDTIGAVTIRRLLSHESGLVSEPPGTDFAALQPVYEGVAERNLARVAEIRTVVPPNTQLKYCNLGYQFLGEIVTRVSGISYPAYVAQRILEPLGMASTGFEPLGDVLDGRRVTGYCGRGFSDELAIAPAMPPIWAEGGLWSTVPDLAKWLSFQLAAHASEPADSPVLAASTRRAMHKPRYLSDEEWLRAWGVSWYGVRKEEAIWIQHSGGLPGFTSNACFDRKSGVGAVVLLNGEADASSLAMSLAEAARGLVAESAPSLAPLACTPDDVRPLLGVYATPDMSSVLRLEWRDGKLTIVDPQVPGEVLPLDRGTEPGTFVFAPGYRPSGETLKVRRESAAGDGADGMVVSIAVGGGTWLRLDPVTAD